ncbi:hypothetical protein, partial [Novosphingobium subterraneum]|uniref:hypothetical protein n=1 Tax=Novosphingobium subterraneum TaxID=48936 RepID=UPI001C3FD112
FGRQPSVANFAFWWEADRRMADPSNVGLTTAQVDGYPSHYEFRGLDIGRSRRPWSEMGNWRERSFWAPLEGPSCSIWQA